MYNPNIPEIKSIFELFVKKVKKLNALCLKENGLEPAEDGTGPLKLVIMTNDLNYGDITGFFKENDYFGYKSIIFFPQELCPPLPAVDLEGNILLSEENSICYTPNGNGVIWP